MDELRSIKRSLNITILFSCLVILVNVTPLKRDKNICYLNSTRQKATRDCCDRFTADKPCYVEFIYDSNQEVYQVCVGMPVLATTNLKSEGDL